MRRVLATLAGFGVGLVLTWLCLVSLSHANLPRSDSGTGCGDVEHCGGASWLGTATLLLYLAPSIAFAIAAYLAAARAWALQRIAAVFIGLGVVTLLGGFALYAA